MKFSSTFIYQILILTVLKAVLCFDMISCLRVIEIKNQLRKFEFCRSA